MPDACGARRITRTTRGSAVGESLLDDGALRGHPQRSVSSPTAWRSAQAPSRLCGEVSGTLQSSRSSWKPMGLGRESASRMRSIRETERQRINLGRTRARGSSGWSWPSGASPPPSMCQSEPRPARSHAVVLHLHSDVLTALGRRKGPAQPGGATSRRKLSGSGSPGAYLPDITPGP